MPNYIRNRNSGATYFFTINLHDRQSNLLITQVNELRQAYQKVQQKMPFTTDAIVILPDHIHALWTLPDNDTDYLYILARCLNVTVRSINVNISKSLKIKFVTPFISILETNCEYLKN